MREDGGVEGDPILGRGRTGGGGDDNETLDAVAVGDEEGDEEKKN